MGRSLEPWLLVAMLAAGPAAAQSQGLVVRDDTLGEGRGDVVGPGVDPLGHDATYLITPELGEQHGSNLFHSFESFGIGENETATFTGPDGIDNVISRVTGGDESQIDGTLRSTIPDADVWLLNPSGVVFGEGAKLDVPGSFHASTGDYLGFGEGDLVRFYADPSRPSVLSTARPEAFGFLNEGGAAALAVEGSQLAVDRGETLELVASGDLSLTRAELTAPGGRVGLEAQGQVALSRSLVDVGREADAPGSISIRGGQIVMEEGSQALAENESTLPAPPDEPGPGSISIAASGSVLVDDSLLSVNTHGAGNAGTIRVNGPEVTFQNGPGLANFYVPDDPSNLPHRISVGARAETTSSGKAGTLELDSGSLTVTAGAGLSAQTVGPDGAFASGAGGDIRLRAASVLVSDLGFATVESWRSTGHAGTITVGSRDAPADTLRIDATRPDGLGSYPTTLTAGSLTRRWVTPTEPNGPVDDPTDLALGDAGTIEIWARALAIENGGNLEAWCIDCVTRGGTVRIRGETMTVDGVTRDGLTSSLVAVEAVGPARRGGGGDIVIALTGALELGGGTPLRPLGGFLSAKTHGDHDAGTITIQAGSVALTEGGSIFAGTSGSGDAGNITIDAGSVVIENGEGGIQADTIGAGHAGDIRIAADHIVVDGKGLNNPNISASTYGGEGNAGTIVLVGRSVLGVPQPLSLELLGGGSLLAQSGNAGTTGGEGTVEIDADSVLIGGGAGFPSGIHVPSLPGAPGKAGSVDIETRTLTLERGGLINATAYAGGEAGPIGVVADSVQVSGTIWAGTRGSGNAGDITIDADSVVITDEGLIRADTQGEGAGGDISVVAHTLLIERGGIISAGSGGIGAAGSVRVTARDSILVTGAGDPRFSLLGIVQILKIPNGRPPITGIFSANGSGSITLDAREITLTDGAIVMASTGSGDAGNIVLSGDRIHVLNGAFVDSTSYAFDGPGGNVGNITLEANELIEVVGSRSGVQKIGKELKPFEDVSRVTSANLSQGEGGTVTLDAPRILIDGGAVATTALPSLNGWEGVSGGNITVSAGELIVRGGGLIDASSFVPASGGAIDITASDSIVVEGQAADGTASGISGRTGASGDGGGVTLRAPVIEVGKFGEISAKSEADPSLEKEAGRIFDSLRDDKVWIGTELLPDVADGDAGTVTLAAEVVVLQNGSSIVAYAGEGTGGNIQVTADNYFTFPDALVDASSDLGIDGTVEVSTPDVDLAGTLTALPASYLDAASLMRERCAARRSGERAGSFAVRGNGGIPAEPDGWLPATLSTELGRGPIATTELPSTSASAPRLVLLGTCQ